MIRKLFIALLEKWTCKHKWEVHRQTSTYAGDSPRPWKITQVLICKECGKIKQIEL